jgi:hypothetical protein
LVVQPHRNNSIRTAAILKILRDRLRHGKVGIEGARPGGSSINSLRFAATRPLGNKHMDYYNSPHSHRREIYFIVAYAKTRAFHPQKSVIVVAYDKHRMYRQLAALRLHRAPCADTATRR